MAEIYQHKFSKYFTYEEFFHSNTAVAKGINNCPDSVGSACNVCSNSIVVLSILELIRESLGAPITITSGFRCAQLNKLVGGKSTSYHQFGAAADIQSRNMRALLTHAESVRVRFMYNNKPLFRIVQENVKNGVPSWLHIQLETIAMRDLYPLHLVFRANSNLNK